MSTMCQTNYNRLLKIKNFVIKIAATNIIAEHKTNTHSFNLIIGSSILVFFSMFTLTILVEI